LRQRIVDVRQANSDRTQTSSNLIMVAHVHVTDR
jgi:hypothetical protein